MFLVVKKIHVINVVEGCYLNRLTKNENIGAGSVCTRTDVEDIVRTKVFT